MSPLGYYSHSTNSLTLLLYYFNLLLNYVFLFGLILFTAFIIMEARKSGTSTLKFSYLFIFITACGVHALVFVIGKISESIPVFDLHETPIHRINAWLGWYHGFSTGFANTMLSLNQITALLFTVKYHGIWRPSITFAVTLITLLYPIVINLVAIQNPCFLSAASTCRFWIVATELTASLHTCINAVLSLSLLIFTVYIIRQKNYQSSSKIECTILWQSFYGSIMLVIYSLVTIIAINRIYIKDYNGYSTLSTLASLLHTLYFVIMLSILFLTK